MAVGEFVCAGSDVGHGSVGSLLKRLKNDEYII